MPRKGKIIVRKIEPDPIYNNGIVTKFINRMMKGGKKSVAQTQMYASFEIIKEKAEKDPLKVFLQAIENTKPSMEVRPRRVGGAAYQIPMSVRGTRRESLAIRWLILAARARSSAEFHSFSQKLAAELIDASKNEGGAVQKRKDIERMAEANKAFAHFRW